MKIFDGTQRAEVSMYTYDCNTGFLSPDFSHDFFTAGSLPYDPKTDCYTVDDVQYVIDVAREWEKENNDTNLVFVCEI